MPDENPYLQYTQSPSPSAPPQQPEGVNPYLQYAKPPSNLYDRTELPGATTPKKNYDLMHWTQFGYLPSPEIPIAAMKNYAQSFENFGKAVGRAYEHPIESTEKAVNIVAGIPASLGSLIGGVAIKSLTPDVQAMMMKDHPVVKNMIETANAVGGDYKNKYGDWESIKRTAAEHPVQFAADMYTLATMTPGFGVARSAVQAGVNALPAAARLPIKALGYAAVPTEALNNVAGAVTSRAVPAAARYVEDVTHPTNYLVRRATEGMAPDINNALTNPAGHQLVPGSIPTGPTAIDPATITATRLQALGSKAEQRLSTVSQNIKQTQNDARLEHIGNSTGYNPADHERALADRSRVADANYSVADRVLSPENAELRRLWSRPEIEEAFRGAQESTFNAGRPFGQTVNGTNYFTGQDLQKVKVRLDAAALKLAKDGADSDTIRDMMTARRDFTNWFERHNDAWRIARDTHRSMSVPINQMEIGRYMQEKMLDPTLAEATASQRAGAYGAALQDANSAVPNSELRRITGQTRTINDVLTPHQIQALEAVRQDFAREALADVHAAKGTPSFGNALDNAVSDAIGITPSANGKLGKVANFFLGGQNNRVADEVANALMTPEGTRQLVRNALIRDVHLGLRRNLYDSIREHIGAPYSFMNRHPGVYNALNADNSQQNGSKK